MFLIMYGRARLSSDVSDIKLVFAIPPERPTPNFAPSWNVAPTDPLPIVHFRRQGGRTQPRRDALGSDPVLGEGHQDRLLDHQRQSRGHRTKPAFREAFQRRRCLLPLDGFYEWKKTATGKQPYAIALADRRLMAMAGLRETWRSPAGERIRSFTIITTRPNELCAELHDRMPVVLKPDVWPLWLGERPLTCRG